MTQIKRQRIAQIFVDTAIKQIKLEGIEALSVRKIAEETGFSYATIYNYFADFNALLWTCKKQMINELTSFMLVQDIDASKAGVHALFKRYVHYFLDHPHIFRFFYFHHVNPGEERFDEFGFDALMIKSFGFLSNTKDEKAIQAIALTCIYAIHGILQLHFSGNDQADQAAIDQNIDTCLDVLLQ